MFLSRNLITPFFVVIAFLSDSNVALMLVLLVAFRHLSLLSLLTFLLILTCTGTIPVLFLVALSSLSTFLVLAAVSGTFAMAYVLMAVQILQLVFVLGNVHMLLNIFMTTTLAIFALSYLRATLSTFAAASALLLVVQKLAVLGFLLGHQIASSMALVALHGVLAIAAMTQTSGRMLVLLNSSVSIAFLASTGNAVDDVIPLFLTIYAAQTFLLFSEFQTSLPVALFTAIIAFGIPVTTANLSKIVLTGFSDIQNLVILFAGYALSLGLFTIMQKPNLSDLGSG